MKELLVGFEIAKTLSEVGFSKPCCARYYRIDANKEEKIIRMFSLERPIDYNSTVIESKILDKFYPFYSAPLWQQVIDWFREDHKLEVSIKSWKNEGDGKIIYVYSVKELGKPSTFRFDVKSEDYYEIVEKAILKALELIKI